MKKNILITILLLSLFAIPPTLQADQPLFVDDGGGGGGGGGGGSGGTTPSLSALPVASSKIFVFTEEASNLTYTTATLRGIGDSILASDTPMWASIDEGKNGIWVNGTDSGTWKVTNFAGGTAGIGTANWTGTRNDGTGTWANSSGLVSGTWTNGRGVGGLGTGIWQAGKINVSTKNTAYFRYSKSAFPPVFCNEVYGANMTSTKDIDLDKIITTKNVFIPELYRTANLKSFSQTIGNLTPDTTYYYCAVVSNKDSIGYEINDNIVKNFHTSPYKTTMKAKSATGIDSNSATLNATYSSIEKLTTYFQYKKYSTDGTTDWSENICAENHDIYENGVKLSNIFGNTKCDLKSIKKLEPSTRYQFRAVARNGVGEEIKITYSNILHFTTSFEDNDTGGGGGGSGSGSGGGGGGNSGGGSGASFCDLYPTNLSCLSTTCRPPTFLDSSSKICVNPVSCKLPLVYYYPTNGCITPVVCVAPKVLNSATNSCITPPTNENFCNTNPNDSICLPGPGWIWNPGNNSWTGGNWNSGSWTGGSWVNGNWTGGYWTSNNPATNQKVWVGGTWSNGSWTGGYWTDKANVGNQGNILTLGQTATPPSDAIVRYHEGIETVFARQIVANQILAQTYGYTQGSDLQSFAWYLADEFAKMFGYIDANRKEIRVSFPDVAAYQLLLTGNTLIVYEYYYDKIVDVRYINTAFKNASDYEYYYNK